MRNHIAAFAAVAVFATLPAAPASLSAPVDAVIASEEFRGHLALTLIKAPYAYATGASGKGVVIAFIDSGIDPDYPDVAPNLSPKSVDIVEGRGRLKGPNLHGMGVAILAAGAFNGFGTMGAAYEATILAIRTDNAAACGGACEFRSVEMAKAIDYATDNGAAIINLSIVGDVPLKKPMTEALKRAAAAGVIIVAAAGNSRDGDPTYPARYASEPWIGGMMIAVGYHDAKGVKDSSSNRPGKARAQFICAPGNTSSAATPFVSGSLALILHAFPDLTPQEAVNALLAGARDAGDPGPDWIYGRGLLDLEGAFAAARASLSEDAGR